MELYRASARWRISVVRRFWRLIPGLDAGEPIMSDLATTRFYFLLPDADGTRLLLHRDDEAVSLPSLEMPRDADLLDVGPFNRAAQAQLGLEVTTLCSRHCYTKSEPSIVVFNLEN